jgi:nucleotide-binding universal stress UspA family protein
MNILVALDLSESSQIVVQQTKKLSKALSAKIWLLHATDQNPELVVAPEGFDDITNLQNVGEVRDAIAKEFHEEHRLLQQFSQELREAGFDCTALLVQGSTKETILNEAAKLSADMIILGSQGKWNIDHFLLGSTSEGILQKSPVPVLVIPTHGAT